MYADVITGSMQRAIDETNRRRTIQLAYNQEHGITPISIQKAIRDVIQSERVSETRSTYRLSPDVAAEHLPLDDMLVTLQEMEAEMKRASKALEFERAADIRDEIQRLKRLLPDQDMLPGKKAPARSR
jgi:excinuclease ABC subunit B